MQFSCTQLRRRPRLLLIFSLLVLYSMTSYAAQPPRVVTLFQGATDSALALGIKPVGVVDSWAEKPTYQYLRSKLEGVTHVGLETQPNLESIAALHPDLIIASKSRHEKIYAQLSKIAPTVLTDNVYDFKNTLKLIALSTGRLQQNKKLLDEWKKRIIQFRKSLQKQQSHWPLTASVLDVRADHIRLYLEDSFTGTVLKDIGFSFPMERSTGWGVKLKTKESLIHVNADVFFVILHSDDILVEQNYNSWRSHPLWKTLNAPTQGQVYMVNKVTWLLSGGILGANLMLDELSDIYLIPKITNQ